MCSCSLACVYIYNNIEIDLYLCDKKDSLHDYAVFTS